MAMLGLYVLNITSDVRVMRAYLVCLAIADIGHIAPTMWMLGWDNSINVANWNAMAWGNIGVTAFLFVNRLAYLLGFYNNNAGRAKLA